MLMSLYLVIQSVFLFSMLSSFCYSYFSGNRQSIDFFANF
jgi:hypothetical protein